mmetsp:Transcript_48286/g.55772  ORF Transcript_48286/g.55772 Transcript_48286/m.55772 type:complete len:202 (-) Transcript_48286:702-1307(-)
MGLWRGILEIDTLRTPVFGQRLGHFGLCFLFFGLFMGILCTLFNCYFFLKHPWMSTDILCCIPFLRIRHQNLPYQVLYFITQRFLNLSREFKFSSTNLADNLSVSISVKRQLSADHAKQNTAHGPDVKRWVDMLACPAKYLWRHISQRAGFAVNLYLRTHTSNTKVHDLDCLTIFRHEQDILKLQISMNELLPVTIANGFC